MYYDYRNRLKWVERRESGEWESLDEYAFDALGRIAHTAEPDGQGGWTQRRFIWGGASDWQALEERETSGDLVARYTYAPGYIDAVAVQERDLNADSDFLDTNETVYYHSNTLFSVYALSDASESIGERYSYDAYGAVTVLDADGSADADGLSDVGNAYTFTGRRLDDESGLMQYRNRWYSPALGRFLSRDPQEYADAYDVYLYATDRPTFAGDPMGLVTWRLAREIRFEGRREYRSGPLMEAGRVQQIAERIRSGILCAGGPTAHAEAEATAFTRRMSREINVNAVVRGLVQVFEPDSEVRRGRPWRPRVRVFRSVRRTVTRCMCPLGAVPTAKGCGYDLTGTCRGHCVEYSPGGDVTRYVPCREGQGSAGAELPLVALLVITWIGCRTRRRANEGKP